MHITLFLVTLIGCLSALENEVFSMMAPADYRIVNNKTNFDIADGQGVVKFTIVVNIDSNAIIMCFCAPLDKYERLKLSGQIAYRYVKDNMYSIKIQSDDKSASIHYFKDSVKSVEHIAIIESLILKRKEMKMGL